MQCSLCNKLKSIAQNKICKSLLRFLSQGKNNKKKILINLYSYKNISLVITGTNQVLQAINAFQEVTQLLFLIPSARRGIDNKDLIGQHTP